MKLKKKIKSKFLIYLRKIGFLCNKNPKPKKIQIRVSRSINVDGTVTEYSSPLNYIPLNEKSFESELHVYHEIKKDTKIKYGKKSTKSKK